MASATPDLAAHERNAGEKAVWVQPSLIRMEVGEAEATDGPGPDGGLAS